MSVNMIYFVLLFQLINNGCYCGYISSQRNKFIWPIFLVKLTRRNQKGFFQMRPGYRFNWLNEPTCMDTKLKRGSQFNRRK